MINLETCTVSHLNTYSNPYDIRRDIHAFVGYIREREVKRGYRNNQLPKADAQRLAKLMSYPDCLAEIQAEGYCWWLDEIDSLALKLGFVAYDTKGEYAGYSSSQPSFRDNYIEYRADVYEAFVKLPLREQEKRLFTILCEDPGYREFYNRHLQSSLKSFTIFGSAVGIMPLLDFPQARRFLFRLLADLEIGRWYTTDSLIRYLQAEHPYFLIPPAEKLPQKDKFNRPQRLARYGNFYESSGESYYHDRNPIPDDAPDGFLRVEGRFVERFLEGIPLTLGYVDVAYDPQPYQGPMPEMGTLQAFRLNGRFHQFMHAATIIPTVTVLPTFEIHVESPFYPAGLIAQLRSFSTLVTADRVSIFKLDKTLVKSAIAADDSLDILALLRQLTQAPLPRNVAVELEEWAGQANVFTLYTDFSLLEGDPQLPEADPFVAAQISDNVRLIRQPDQTFNALEQAERVPLAIRHHEDRFTPLPVAARTLFPKQKEAKQPPKRKRKPALTLQRETHIRLTAPSAETYEKLRAALLKQRCLFTADAPQYAITYARQYQPQVDAALAALRQHYVIQIEDNAL